MSSNIKRVTGKVQSTSLVDDENDFVKVIIKCGSWRVNTDNPIQVEVTMLVPEHEASMWRLGETVEFEMTSMAVRVKRGA